MQVVRRNQVYFSSSNVSNLRNFLIARTSVISREISSFCCSSFILRVAILSFYHMSVYLADFNLAACDLLRFH